MERGSFSSRGRWEGLVEGGVVWGIVSLCMGGLVASLWVLLGGRGWVWEQAWAMVGERCALGLDALSAWFAVPLSIVGGLGAVYGRGYMRHAGWGMRMRGWWWYAALLASMWVVLMARSRMVFLLAWEVMTLTSFFLVMLEGQGVESRRAGWMYLVAGHLGMAALVVWSVLVPWGGVAKASMSLVFLVGLVGFGVKAGMVPLHVWLPEAHTVAPSHVSAMMSGVMIKMGVYGILRTLVWAGELEEWWGWSLICVGVLSGILGATNALAQRDMKRLLAYSSVDNVGIIMMGLGCGVVGRALGMSIVSACGFAGALLHVWHHAIFKGLLFLGAGAVMDGVGTRNLNELGGIGQRMRWTSVCVCIGALAMAAAPVLNGSVSEGLVVVGGMLGGQAAGMHALGPVGVVVGMALTGALAALCSVVLFGIAFLGEARSAAAAQAKEVGVAMRAPMVVLAALCVMTGCVPILTMMGSMPVIAQLMGNEGGSALEMVWRMTKGMSVVAVSLVGMGLLLHALRQRAIERNGRVWQPTWGCGYLEPTARMQYSGLSLVQPVLRVLGWLVCVRESGGQVAETFPRAAMFKREVSDAVTYSLHRVMSKMRGVVEWVRILQHGRVHAYLLYIVLTLLVLLAWKGR